MIAPKASEQILTLKSLQNKVDELVKRVDASYTNDATPSPYHRRKTETIIIIIIH